VRRGGQVARRAVNWVTQMFDIGFPELVMIMVIALLVFGPGKMAQIGRDLGKGLRDFRRATSDVTKEFNEALSLEEPVKPAPAAAPVSAPVYSPPPVVPQPDALEAAAGTPAVAGVEGTPAAASVEETPAAINIEETPVIVPPTLAATVLALESSSSEPVAPSEAVKVAEDAAQDVTQDAKDASDAPEASVIEDQTANAPFGETPQTEAGESAATTELLQVEACSDGPGPC
jgi:TatA/E family protein of Tat protein translocase